MKRILPILLIMTVLCLSSCSNSSWKDYYQSTESKTIPALDLSTDNIASDDMLKELNTAYGLANINDFTLKHQDGKVIAEFGFNGNVGRSEILSACDFGYTKLHTAYTIQSSPLVFDEWLMSTSLMEDGIQETLIIIKIEGLELIRQLYRDGMIEDAWEDNETYWELRAADDADYELVVGIVHDKISKADIKLQKSLIHDGYILGISTDDIIDPKVYEALKESLPDALPMDAILLYSSDGLYSHFHP